MKGKKIAALISAVCGLALGVAMLITALMDVALPKPLYFVFAAVCFVNAAFIWTHFRK